ncbi:hypothetical protein [Burkholderia contaminans]|uniref:hypothetical protein n=1 Tax=Burkholderia contaminans TaxID=488447 RepID=UPI001454597B|nr:hypothetical protein [Burkholderia contaminans]MCA8150672.1 hypothetical protein [Burkholderia contaminans]VWC76833.1 hypothetical protein BCO19218_00947 [Burkholderia contaminans]
MSNRFIALKCTLSWHESSEGIKLNSDGTWHEASPNKWLPYPKGKWTQDFNKGVMVRGDDNTNILFLVGFIFSTAAEHQHGRLLWEIDGGGGTWTVFSVI